MAMRQASKSVRAYRNGDEAAILDIWAKALEADAIDADTFAQKVLADPNLERDGLLIAESDGRPAGFLIALTRRVPLGPDGDLEPGIGWISAFAVAPEFEHCGIGTALLEAGEQYIRSRGGERIEISPYAPNYFWPGPDRDRHAVALSFLNRRGYKLAYEVVAMDRNLVGFSVPERVLRLKRDLEQSGFTFARLSPRYVRSLIEFNERVFYPDWARAMRDTVARRVPWDRTLICLQNDEVCGFSQFGAYDHVPDRFGPFGVDEKLRGKGIGKVLLYMTLRALVEKGFHDTWFLWTGETAPAGYLYTSAQFQITRRFHIVVKDFKEGN